jgi:hypothetical protein
VTNPGWLNDMFAALMIVVAAYSAGRLLVSRRWSRPTHTDVEVAHILMGTAMAGMLVTDLNPLPVGLWEFVFSGLAGWFVWRCYQFVRDPSTGLAYDQNVHRLSRRLIHLVMALAMLYMYLAAAPAAVDTGGSMAMGAATGGTTNFVLLPLAFIVSLFASAIWELDRIGHRSSSRAAVGQGAPVSASVGGGLPSVSEGSDSPTDRAGTSATQWLAPRLEGVCHIAMCVTMGYMLVLML